MAKNKKKKHQVKMNKRTEELRRRSEVENQAEQFIFAINTGKTIANFLQEEAKGLIEFLSPTIEEEGEHKGENVFQLVVQREKVNEALAHYFIMLPSEDKERFLDFLGTCSQSGRRARKNMLWEIALAAAKGHPALLNALADYVENLPLEPFLNKLLSFLQETAQSGCHAGINTLWIIALAAVNGYPALLNALAKNFEKISPEQILDKLLMLLQETARSEAGVDLGLNTLGVIAYAAGNGYPALLNALAKYFENVPLDKLLPLLQKTIQSGLDAGMNTLGIIAFAAGVGHPALLNALAKYFENIPLDRLLPFLQETVQSGAYADMNTLGIIAFTAVKGHPALLNALAKNFKNVPPEQLVNLLLPLLQKTLLRGGDAGMNMIGIIAKAAACGFPAFLNAITKALMCLKLASRFSLMEQGPPGLKTVDLILSAAVQSNRVQEFEWLLCCFKLICRSNTQEGRYVRHVLPLLRAANRLIESLYPPSTYETKEEIADRKITSEELTQLRTALSIFSSDPDSPPLKTNLISIVFSKLQRHIDQMTFLNILAEIMPNSVGDYELVRLYVDYLILVSSDFSGERKKNYLECAFEKLRRIPFGEHHESDFILWDRLITKVIESDKSKGNYTLGNLKPLRDGIIVDLPILIDIFNYEMFSVRCLEYIKNLEAEKSKKEENKNHSEFFPSLQPPKVIPSYLEVMKWNLK
ncbi:hypothetical protein CbuD7D7780_00010 [Coxiella burnetii]|uniref:Uncharacterized protein n=1 Tax=Coxiella burnetii (strain Dugway 5J108-111) TaxID=434922 RepID=A9KEV5_COXBN|nr:hypothetical protein [Coxiella burnetii]ABS76515.1 hypothetical protein CBUD_0009 [Coxiella burnetii Dugway 5J108-111]OYK83167.1 hypothetical protein CbuD7D7780_00010 [Coxiella burnetii]